MTAAAEFAPLLERAMAWLDAAFGYAAAGVPVFPCVVGGKRPACTHGVHEATTDLARIGRWWDRHPDHNIGLACGAAFDVLDVDHPDGWSSLAALVATHGCLDHGGAQLTPSGGAHYLFAPTGHGNTAGRRPGLDWRGRGGYIVAAPSTVNGGAYEWADSPTLKPPPAPAWLVEAVVAPPRASVPSPAPPNGKDPGTRNFSVGGQSHSCSGLVAAVATAVDGQRNATLNWAALRVGADRRSGRLDDNRAIAALEQLAVAAGRAGLAEREIDATIRSGYRAGLDGKASR